MRKESSTNFENEKTLNLYCNAAKTLNLIRGRWKLSILFGLLEKDMHYSNLKILLPTISDRILSLQLRELQQDGLIEKEESDESNKQKYRVSSKGKRFEVVIRALSDWR